MSYTRDERQVEQRRDFRPDLAGVGVDRVAAGEHEIERALASERRRQRFRRREGVGAGERSVGHVHALDVDVALEAPGDRLSQRVVGGGRPEREHDDARPQPFGRELDRLADRAPAVRIHLGLDAVAAQTSVGSELHLLELRNLLHQYRDAHEGPSNNLTSV